MNKKKSATSFLRLASSGRVHEAFAQFVHPEFRHHNARFKGDRQSLLKAMADNAHEFPDKTYETLRVLEDGALVAVHGKVALSPDTQWAVIHILRFADNQIIEMWEASQEVLADTPNENGIF